MKTATVTRGPLTFAQSFPANVSYNEYQYAIVQARAAGFIDKVYPLTVGDKVQKGAPLLDLTIPDWVEAQSGIYCCAKPAVRRPRLKAFLSDCDWRECRRLIFAV